jgi:hypothetical protein
MDARVNSYCRRVVVVVLRAKIEEMLTADDMVRIRDDLVFTTKGRELVIGANIMCSSTAGINLPDVTFDPTRVWDTG